MDSSCGNIMFECRNWCVLLEGDATQIFKEGNALIDALAKLGLRLQYGESLNA